MITLAAYEGPRLRGGDIAWNESSCSQKLAICPGFREAVNRRRYPPKTTSLFVAFVRDYASAPDAPRFFGGLAPVGGTVSRPKGISSRAARRMTGRACC